MAVYSLESNRGWVSFKDAEWLECEVLDSSKKSITLKLQDGTSKVFARSDCQFCYRNPSSVENSSDFLTLPNLDEPNILHSLRVRYWQAICMLYIFEIFTMNDQNFVTTGPCLFLHWAYTHRCKSMEACRHLHNQGHGAS